MLFSSPKRNIISKMTATWLHPLGEDCLPCLKMAASGKHKVIPNFTWFLKSLLKSSLCAMHEPLSSFKMQISLQNTNFTLGYQNFEFKHILKTLERWLVRVCIKVFLKLLSCLDIIIFQVRSGRTTPNPLSSNQLVLIPSLVQKIPQPHRILSSRAGCLQTLHLPCCISTCQPTRQLLKVTVLSITSFMCQHLVSVLILVFSSSPSIDSCCYSASE